jgi:hypothetical protein
LYGAFTLHLKSISAISGFVGIGLRETSVLQGVTTCRETERVEEAHAARLLSDSLWFGVGAWPVVARVVAIHPDTVEGYKDIEDDLARLSKRFQTVEAEFWATQNSSDTST